MKRKIVVIGSSNTDMVIKASALPRPGETILGGRFLMTAGGKGANQAVASARLGGDVTFVCKVGNDIFGVQAKEGFRKEGIDTSSLFTDEENPSGVALITVDQHAENCIAVASGANANLLPSDIDIAMSALLSADIILMQLETPIETIEYVASIAHQHAIPVVLNPAPAQTLSSDLLKNLFLLTPNETEAELISGIAIKTEEDTVAAARKIHEMGVDQVIITLGSKGALYFDGQQFEMVPALKVEAVDTTAAGDVFNGALVVAIAEGESVLDAIRFGCKASAIAVTRMGAQSSAPVRDEIG